MSIRVEVRPELLEWARARSGIDEEVWDRRFPRYETWLGGQASPTIKQLEEFARKTYIPVGFFFLDEPPTEEVPIPNSERSVISLWRVWAARCLPTCSTPCTGAKPVRSGTRDNQLLNGEAPLDFVGNSTLRTPTSDVVDQMRVVLDWTVETPQRLNSWGEALTRLRENAETAGVLVMISGIVGSNTHRKLDPDEFRGFALADPYAAVVFVNGADSKAAQVFTLAHELAHIWLGETALSDVNPESTRTYAPERWCNQAAAELLVPMDEFRRVFDPASDLRSQLQPLAERFRVSTQVILGRMREAGALSWDQFLWGNVSLPLTSKRPQRRLER